MEEEGLAEEEVAEEDEDEVVAVETETPKSKKTVSEMLR